MSIGDPPDGFNSPTLALMIDYYILIQRCNVARQQALIGRRDLLTTNHSSTVRQRDITTDVAVCINCCTSDFCNDQGCGYTGRLLMFSSLQHMITYTCVL